MSKYKEIVLETLQEAKQVGTLYHNTPALKEILESNELIGYYSVGLSFDTKEGWFNDRDWHQNSYYTLIFDGDKLSETNNLKYSDRTPNEVVLIPSHQKPKKIDNEYIQAKWDKIPEDHPLKQNPDGYEIFLDQIKPYSIYDPDLKEPLVLNNINKYLKGLIVRYPNDWEAEHKNLSKIIEDINKNIALFKSLYPNLPIYLRNENGIKAVRDKKQIDQLSNKTINY